MKRLTKRTGKTIFYCHDGNLYTEQYMDSVDVLHVLQKLEDYEDREEEREKGCCFCTELPEEGIYGITYDANRNPVIETAFDMLPLKVKFCPECGRRLTRRI